MEIRIISDVYDQQEHTTTDINELSAEIPATAKITADISKIGNKTAGTTAIVTTECSVTVILDSDLS